MNLLSEEISAMAANSSWIRKMFEEGIELKKKYGEDNVYDFSLGNPDMPAPAVVGETLRKIADVPSGITAGGAIWNGRIYFCSHSHLMSCAYPQER